MTLGGLLIVFSIPAAYVGWLLTANQAPVRQLPRQTVGLCVALAAVVAGVVGGALVAGGHPL